ncbi:MAG: arylsulfatase [Planctomycetota bacterium]|jgi:arylsulfatase/arylsulfatase A
MLLPLILANLPNIVLILTDDQGYEDFGAMGHPVLVTPHLDALRAQSPKVERFYVSPVCSPTRAALMTGRYPYRTRVVDTWIGRSMMDPTEVTVAELLRDAGYTTGLFGKWHLGDCYPMRPQDQGFEQVLMHRGGGLAQPSEPPANDGRYTDPILFRNGEQIATEGYCTDVYFDAALEFIERSVESERPFFAYVPTNAPHGPFGDVPEDLRRTYVERGLDDREARICAMIENVDQNVGRLLERLDGLEIADDTLVMFLCDNGPIGGRPYASADALRGAKGTVYEGGIRTPLFVRWPGELTPEAVLDRHLAHIDVLPTLLELAGVETPDGLEVDGRSFASELRGLGGGTDDRHLFLQAHRGDAPVAEHNMAVVGTRWKLVRASGFGRSEAVPEHPFELYDLLEDPGETSDLASDRPDVVEALRERYATWFEDVSTTRDDNYAPPRIVIGDPAEPSTALTRQDWRPDDGVGWGAGGEWLLEARPGTRMACTVLFVEPQAPETVRVHLGDRSIEVTGTQDGLSTRFGPFALPALEAGPLALRVEVEAGGEAIAVHQVLLDPR